MEVPHVFAYGSLLGESSGTPCRLEGFRRVWGVAMDNRRTIPGYKYYLAPDGSRPEVCVAFLDLVEDPGAAVDGLAFEVPDLDALDARERNYRRVQADGLWLYTGLEEARERFAAGPTVVARAYLEGVRAGLAARGLELDAPMDLPVRDLVRIDVPV